MTRSSSSGVPLRRFHFALFVLFLTLGVLTISRFRPAFLINVHPTGLYV